MKKKFQNGKVPSTPNIRKDLSSTNRKGTNDPSSTTGADDSKRLSRSSKLREQKESLKNSK